MLDFTCFGFSVHKAIQTLKWTKFSSRFKASYISLHYISFAAMTNLLQVKTYRNKEIKESV